MDANALAFGEIQTWGYAQSTRVHSRATTGCLRFVRMLRMLAWCMWWLKVRRRDAETLRPQRSQRRDAVKYTSGMSFALTIATLSKQLANLIH